MKKYQLLLFFGMLFFFLSRPNAQIFAACGPMPDIGSQPFDADCTIDSNTFTGIDAGSGVTNTAILTFNTPGVSLTINSCATLLVGEIVLTSTDENRGYIALLNAPDPDLYDPCTTTGTYDSGKIILGSPIYITDSDNDGYPANNTLYTETASGRQRFSSMNAQWNTYTDCADNDAANFAALVCYPDGDSDGHYSEVSQAVCDTVSACNLLSPAQSATMGDDCCDTSAIAEPDQTNFYSTALTYSATCPVTTADDYDYNCDEAETLDSTGINGSTYACTNPCSGCDLDYSVTAGWSTAPPATCGESGTKYTMSGSYVSGTCYEVASCATLATSASAQRGCR